MDGEATDCMVDADGDLVMFRTTTVRLLDGGTVLAIVLQGEAGDVGVQIFGSITKELAAALLTAAHGVQEALKPQS